MKRTLMGKTVIVVGLAGFKKADEPLIQEALRRVGYDCRIETTFLPSKQKYDARIIEHSAVVHPNGSPLDEVASIGAGWETDLQSLIGAFRRVVERLS
ncbi:hypothetical protein GC176_27590 [bacterium]|nr:hypothetical protein [bacterium]